MKFHTNLNVYFSEMPAKKARRISKQNREILRRNYNKKLIQLNKLVYELSWYSSEVSLQREFIQNFFNKQIDYSISIYRNQVKKLQNSSVDDYNFIVERTDRFYQRKYQKMKEMECADGSNVFTEISLFEKDIINAECQNLKNAINDINQKIRNEQKKYEEEIQNWQSSLFKKIKEVELEGQNNIDDFLKKSEEKYKKYKDDFNKRCEVLLKNLNGEVAKLKNEKLDLNIQTCSFHYQKIDLNQYRSGIESIQKQHLAQLYKIKIQIINKINEIKTKDDLFQIEHKETANNITNQISEMNKLIGKLNDDINLLLGQNNSELSSLKSNFEQLRNRNKEIIDEQSQLINQNSISSKSSIDYLIQSLQTKFDIFKQKISTEEQRKNYITNSISQEIEVSQKEFASQLSELTTELNSQKNQHKAIVEDFQNAFFSEKNEIMKVYQKKLDEAKSSIFLLKSNEDQVHNDCNLTLKNLQNEKKMLVSTHQKDLEELDQETENILNKLAIDHEYNMKTLQAQLDEMRNKDNIYFTSKIDEIEKQNQEIINHFKQQKETEYKSQIESLIKSGYSKDEYEKLENSYQKEFEYLQNKLNEANVITPESEIFKNMARVISDLKSEFKDHEVIIQSRARCLNFEWQQKIKKENERFARSPFNSAVLTNPRARDQMRKSFQGRIEDVQKEKNEILAKINEAQNSELIKERSKNVNLKDLQNEQEQIDQQKNILVQEALIKKEEMIKNKKEQIDQIQIQFGQEKRELLNKINDQKTEFNSTYKKLNDSLLSAQIKHNQAEQNENNSFQSKLNAINFLFCEKKSELMSKINEMNDRSSSKSLSSSISSVSSSSSSSSLITQETREAWTKQRIDFDAKVQCLREQISSEISKLNAKKDEISKNLDRIWKEKLDRKMKLSKIMSNWSSRSSDADIIAMLESNLKAVTLQLNSAINEMKKYKNLLIEQETQISKKFGGMSDIILLQ